MTNLEYILNKESNKDLRDRLIKEVLEKRTDLKDKDITTVYNYLSQIHLSPKEEREKNKKLYVWSDCNNVLLSTNGYKYLESARLILRKDGALSVEIEDYDNDSWEYVLDCESTKALKEALMNIEM